MKQVFVDVYLSFNFGDDLFLDILAKKFPNCHFTVNYVGDNYDDFLKRYQNVGRRRYTLVDKILQNLKIKDTLTDYESIAREQDALVFIGGSIFREESFHEPLYIDRMKLVKAFKSLNKPVYVIGANFGPVKTQGFIDDYKVFYKLCDDVCFRDEASFNLFQELPNVRLAPDVVFQLDVNNYKKQCDFKRVGFSIIDVNHKDGLSQYEERYINSTVKTIENLVLKGYECWLMSFCLNEGDLKVIEEIQRRLSADILSQVKVYNYCGDIEELLGLMGTFEMCIAARFHANIISQLLEVGTMPVIYSEKTTNMLKDLGLSQLLIEMDCLEDMYDESCLELAFSNKVSLELTKEAAVLQFAKLAQFIA